MSFFTTSRQPLIKNLLLYSFVLLLLGRFWQYVFWDMPIREWLWSEDFAKPIMTFICQCSWEEYLSSPAWDRGIQLSIRIQGYVLGIIALLLLIPRIPLKIKIAGSWIAFFLFTLLSLCLFKENFFRWGYLIEISSQWLFPLIFLYLVLQQKTLYRIEILKIILALTFLGHGLYAMGYYPVPGIFVDMMISGFHMDEDSALFFLKIIGYADFVATIALFIPLTEKAGVYYMILWGGLTTIARISTQVSEGSLFWPTFNQWALESFIRIPHFTLPIILLLIIKERENETA